MRIAISADPELPVPPLHYGGIERMIALLVEGLVKRGHEVTLFAHAESKVPCRLVPYPAESSRGLGNVLRNMACIARETARGRYDVFHSFGRVAYLAPLLRSSLPKVMTYQREIPERTVVWGSRLSGGTLRFTACGEHMIGGLRKFAPWYTVHNAVSPELYTSRESVEPDAPLAFLGRIEKIKGPHIAIEVARLSGRRLVIAGNIPDDPASREFFRESVEPHLDGDRIRYIGPVDDTQKNEMLGAAWAFLMPILWEEPFGIVMAEALACGTPIIGLRAGSVPEVVEDGVTGFICSNAAEMARAVDRIASIDRRACRRRMEDLFSASVMTEAYLGVYREAVKR